MSDKEEKEEEVPRWDVIEKLHDKIDEDINSAYKEDKLSFIEVDVALLMISEKINQQKKGTGGKVRISNSLESDPEAPINRFFFFF